MMTIDQEMYIIIVNFNTPYVGRGGGRSIMYNDDDVYQYIAHLVLLFCVVMMELSFVIIYSTMGLLIYKYEPY